VSVAVHFNISAYAPFYLINSFLYTFLVFGIIYNPETGKMECPSPNITWFVSLMRRHIRGESRRKQEGDEWKRGRDKERKGKTRVR
jgi:hypothetical protein